MALIILADRSRIKGQRKVWKSTQTCIMVTGVVITNRAPPYAMLPAVQATVSVQCGQVRLHVCLPDSPGEHEGHAVTHFPQV